MVHIVYVQVYVGIIGIPQEHVNFIYLHKLDLFEQVCFMYYPKAELYSTTLWLHCIILWHAALTCFT